ncbi:hypothetical protein [Aetokthonos hydrillicola]|jgi:hypothetical protein|uniref:hypothetical protein n=1 Tax=Aetokthonos hydrillicola TaxID=1550245 RepID=UPI001ABA1ECC|nr:hypothetical protein [Aetokthonos hydrillicola]MBO3457264.1 hypothetical protein [Aetokthonos hydrillicola CCALA 1050]MBW4586606.1 hypothetical protein [Aetokthonos hydrillicola CCALA 1050]
MIFDSNQQELGDNLIEKLLQHHDKDFSAWWNAEQQNVSGGFGEDERQVYSALIHNRKATVEDLVNYTSFTHKKVSDALEVIAGTGVIRLFDDEFYILGSRLFEEWVKQR